MAIPTGGWQQMLTNYARQQGNPWQTPPLPLFGPAANQTLRGAYGALMDLLMRGGQEAPGLRAGRQAVASQTSAEAGRGLPADLAGMLSGATGRGMSRIGAVEDAQARQRQMEVLSMIQQLLFGPATSDYKLQLAKRINEIQESQSGMGAAFMGKVF